MTNPSDADEIERIRADNEGLSGALKRIAYGIPEPQSLSVCRIIAKQALAAQEHIGKRVSGRREPCCQYHNDGGDTEAECCNTEPREAGSP